MYLLQFDELIRRYCRLYYKCAAFTQKDCFYLKKLLSALVFFRYVV